MRCRGLGQSGPDAKINIVGDNGKTYAIKFSLKGFSAAHDDMVSQARAKAKPARRATRRQALIEVVTMKSVLLTVVAGALFASGAAFAQAADRQPPRVPT